jgi:hypothetical protein
MQRRVALALAATLVLFAPDAFANSGGLPGYTGKPTVISPQGESCNQCHTGGTAPTVALNGPATLAAGQTAEYQLVVTTALVRAGAGIAGSDGVILAPVAGLRDSFGEMVQDAPLVVSGGSATFRFKVTAPATGTSLKLWAVGLAANNSGSNAGDRATHTTRDIAITGGAPAPTPDAGAPSGGGGGGGGDGGITPSTAGPGTGTPGDPANANGTTQDQATEPGGAGTADAPANDGNGPADPSPSYGAGHGRGPAAAPDAASCSAGAIAIDGDGLAAAAFVLIAAASAIRRRRRA